MSNGRNLTDEEFLVSKKERRELSKHHSFIVWFTGLSGSGKSTLAKNLSIELHKRNLRTYSLDGDNIRQGLNNDLGFSEEDRKENIRRIGEVAKLMIDAGIITTASFISPYREERNFVRGIVDEGEFIEVYVNAPLDVCEKRDVKGLYKKAREGTIKKFTGISDPYEEPLSAEIEVRTDELSIKECVDKIITYLEEKKLI